VKRRSSKSGTAGIPLPQFLDIEDLRKLSGYAHWIPITHGLYRNFFVKRYPFWEWNQIIPELIQSKVLVLHSSETKHLALSQNLYIARDIQGVSIQIRDGKVEISIRETDAKEKGSCQS
jgi:hypothetical protein